MRDGEIVAAAQEERFTRKKHDYRFPTHAVNYCLQAGRIDATDLDHVVFYDKPLLKFERMTLASKQGSGGPKRGRVRNGDAASLDLDTTVGRVG